VVILFLT